MSRRAWLAGGALALAGGCAAALWSARPARFGRLFMPVWVKTIRDISYGPAPENRLDILRARWNTRRGCPAVLVFHGGGWQTGGRDDMLYPVCRRYLKQGFVVANAEYRLGAVATAAEDAVAALRWFSAEADRYDANPREMVVTGVSAGAHLSLLAGFRSNVPVRAIVNFYGPAELEPLLANPPIRAVLPGADPRLLARRLSPLTYVRGGLPPVFSVHGGDDDIVPPEQTATLTRSLREAGDDADVLYVEGGRHGFSLEQQDTAYRAVFEFLRRRGISGS